MIKEFKMSTKLTELDLYKIFGGHGRYVRAGNFYYIFFNGKDMSGETPLELFEKVKNEYKSYVEKEIAN